MAAFVRLWQGGRLDRIETILEAQTNHVSRTDRQIEALLTHGQSVNEMLSRAAEWQLSSLKPNGGSPKPRITPRIG
jgi:hypothetical protein